MRRYFEKFGALEDCVIMVDRDNKTRGFGFVTFTTESALNDCMYIGKSHSID
jgi:RNA recognition motif-containing protein